MAALLHPVTFFAQLVTIREMRSEVPPSAHIAALEITVVHIGRSDGLAPTGRVDETAAADIDSHMGDA